MPSCVAPTPCCRMKFAFYPLKKSNRNFTPGVQHDQKHTSTTSGDTQSSARFIVDTCMPAAIRSMKKPWIGERTAFSAHTTSHPFALQLRRSKTVRAQASWDRSETTWVFRIRGNGFLQYMVRTITGTLLNIGQRRLRPEQLPQIFDARDRRLAGPSLPAHGLHLIQVDYRE
jgi:tRNA pseudouridine(38-40) synthase